VMTVILTQLRYSVVVSTPDSESGNPGSNPGTANLFCYASSPIPNQWFAQSWLRRYRTIFPLPHRTIQAAILTVTSDRTESSGPEPQLQPCSSMADRLLVLEADILRR